MLYPEKFNTARFYNNSLNVLGFEEQKVIFKKQVYYAYRSEYKLNGYSVDITLE